MAQSETMHLAADISFIHTDHLWADCRVVGRL